MQVSISVRHGQLAESTQEKLKGKAEKLSRYFDRLMAIEIIVDLQNEQEPAVEILVSAEHKHDFVASDKSGNLISATDAVVQKIEHQLRKYKEKVQQKHRHPMPREDMTPHQGEVLSESESQEDVYDDIDD
ncbi:MAG: ribosome-associated translation inhibitor RaiA [Planctomycetes bacterium]|nr:ribosome-associated translation inhibitor RaiA [Planctomycetota bacterium]